MVVKLNGTVQFLEHLQQHGSSQRLHAHKTEEHRNCKDQRKDGMHIRNSRALEEDTQHKTCRNDKGDQGAHPQVATP
jgi:hypothetical protein